ncbi:MAG TPA: hypothetical protein DEB28_17275 [Hyphomonas sp.]|nr:hypothetical protein [Hyphomonas sp.]MAX82789.1 hypothetical protein [Hyphomonas sp.]HAW55353.1 hypothetical protein [Hyphomonas sp.]HBJ40473.1 hypothetical protein [Hyphomonas sp.]HBN92706.1 hypothetical protein [Hyphomonas sp.]
MRIRLRICALILFHICADTDFLSFSLQQACRALIEVIAGDLPAPLATALPCLVYAKLDEV